MPGLNFFIRKKSTPVPSLDPSAALPSNQYQAKALSPVNGETGWNKTLGKADPGEGERQKKKSWDRESKAKDGEKSPSASHHSKRSFIGRGRRKRSDDSEEHPLNLSPEQRNQRLLNLSTTAMSAARDTDGEPMVEGTPAPQTPTSSAPGAFPMSNGDVNMTGDGDDGEAAGRSEEGSDAPVPPAHGAQENGEVEKEKEDPEARKAAGNAFYKAKEYARAVEEYSKGEA